MQCLKTAFHSGVAPSDVSPLSEYKVIERHATRAIVVKGEKILLLYTRRYDDYSLPGGGIDKGEEVEEGLIRELKEETGALGICNIKPFARYDEYRPWHKSDGDFIHMISYCYECDVDEELGDTALESHEIKNGMKPLWINIYEAIAHNKEVMINSDKKGLSIERETYLLQQIVEKILCIDGDN
ncbi:MAG: NUDIX hydrolase [Paraglaciecola sp.]|uniref:NUDIX hydrolase n=1 Tax=Paraglaciecola sp. TaxID=1920173 RepID=UPI003296EF11